jgi:hypothetical protein
MQVKVELAFCLINSNTMKAFLNTALDEGEWPISRLGLYVIK